MKNYSIVFIGISLLLFSCNNKPQTDKYNTDKYKELKTKLEEGLDLEQKVREQMVSVLDTGNFDLSLNEKMGYIDSANFVLVKQFLNEYGYPSISKDGKKLAKAVFNILQHNDLETRERYIDVLYERAYENEASKIHSALMKDRILMENNLKQIYGTQCVPRKDKNGYITTDYFIWPIQNNDIVDSLRKDIGFKTTVKQMATDINAEYNLLETLPAIK